MKFHIVFMIAALMFSLTIHAAEKVVGNGFLGYKSNPVKLTFESGQQGKTPAGTKVNILIWSLSYTKDYMKDFMSSVTKEEKKTLKHNKEASSCLNNDTCIAVIKKYDKDGLIMRSYKLRVEYGESVEKYSLVTLLDGPFKGRKVWVGDADLYMRR